MVVLSTSIITSRIYFMSQGGDNASPIRVVSPSNLALIIFLRVWNTSHPITMDLMGGEMEGRDGYYIF